MTSELNETRWAVCESENHESLSPRAVKYEPTAWDGDTFIKNNAPIQKNREWIEGRIRELKEEVRAIFVSTIDTVEMVNLVDTIEHLGIGYHFKRDIDDALCHLHDAKLDSCDVHHVATRFRLLRQHGFNVSSDEFVIFKDDVGNFNQILAKDPKGLLSLYNAGYLAVPGEGILADAIYFSRYHLTSMVDDLKAPLKEQVVRALKTPLHRMITRVEARFYIEEYAEEHHNDVLLELAKLDFNVLQSLHFEEMKDLSLWWKNLNIGDNLKYARDRLLECFVFWAMGLYFEPKYFRARAMLTKTLALLTIVDDTFDVHGTYEDCKLLNEAIHRWDGKAADILPMYLRELYLNLIDTINSFEAELEHSEKYRMPYLVEAIQTLINGYMQEVEWHAGGCVPSFNERKAPALVGNISTVVVVGPFVGMPGEIIPKEVFLWLTTIPSVAVDCMSICRYIDEYVSFERESESRQGPTMMKCYMIEHNLTKEAACAKFQSFCDDAWKRLNHACLQPTDDAVPVLERLINHSRLMVTMYLHFNDGFNKCSNVKEIIALLMLKPFPL